MTHIPETMEMNNRRQFTRAFRTQAVHRFRLFRNASCRATLLAVALLAGGMLFSASANASCNRWPSPKSPAAMPKLKLTQALGSLQPSFAPSSPEDEQDSIVGMWDVKFLLARGQLYDEGFDVWHADGTEILNDNGVPPSQGNVCLGVWKKTGPRTFKLKHFAWNWDANGNLTGTLIIRETVTVDADRDSYTGSFTFDFYDLSGNLTSEVTGELNATRISAD